ncbi:MAG: zeta toxin family protein [Deltaproteobacteria bacterium]|nr:MAG: zeta toxin family protein [Deltaproteobacteria bacterium]
MTSESHRRRSETREPRIVVEDDGVRRPFMRGILTHSLMARGVSFDEAFRTANAVRTRLRGRSVVTRAELAQAIKDIMGPDAPGEELKPGALPLDIAVVGRERATPFSKGILAQSLLAAALDPTDAFDVARELERQLRTRGAREIERRELRRLAYQTLQHRFDQPTAERYLVWRKFQEPERPVILLLGGAAGVGKTTLAQEVAHRLGITGVISGDSIRQIMRLTLSPELMPLIHKSSFDAYEMLGPDGVGEDPVIEAFRAQASVTAVGVRAMMDRAVAENTSLILDGVSVVPGLIDLESYADTAYVIFLVVATLDAASLRSRFGARGEHARARSPHRYLEHMDAILRIQDHLLEMADRHDVPIVDNESFDRSVLSIIRHLTEALRKRESFDAAELL